MKIEVKHIGEIEVEVMPDGPYWYCEGVIWNYGAQGDSVAEAIEHFQIGLARTIELNKEMRGLEPDQIEHLKYKPGEREVLIAERQSWE